MLHPNERLSLEEINLAGWQQLVYTLRFYFRLLVYKEDDRNLSMLSLPEMKRMLDWTRTPRDSSTEPEN